MPTKFLYFDVFQNTSASKLLIAKEVCILVYPLIFLRLFLLYCHSLDVRPVELNERTLEAVRLSEDHKVVS